LRSGARKLLAQAIEAEVSDFLDRHSGFLTEEGQQRLVRHGHLPERGIMTGIGPVGVRAPRVRASANWAISAYDRKRSTLRTEAMSGRLGMNKCRLASLIRLSYLAPDMVRALLEGSQPIELTPTRLLRLSKDLPHDWSEQRHVLGFAA
jgi:hypothetical protein